MKGLALAAIWIAATVAATSLAWAGVRSVVADVRAPLPAAPATTTAAKPTPEPTPAASEPGEPRRTRTFELVGGTATVRFAPDAVEVLAAVPTAGFAVEIESEDSGTRVDFESDAHRSRLRVWWRDGPRHQIDEGPHDGGGEEPEEHSGGSDHG